MGDLRPTTTTATVVAAADVSTSGNGDGIKRLRSPINKKSVEVPPWVLVMIKIMQYKDCPIHSTTKENKLDRFCINCVQSFCNECSSNHQGHKYLKIRRYIYSDVVNRPDLQKHFDCSGIQGYVTNKNKVLFLRGRGGDNQQPQNSKDHICIICNQTLIDSIYCSIECKICATKTESMEGSSVDNSLDKSKSDEEPDNTLVTPNKKRPRKGVAKRAPFF